MAEIRKLDVGKALDKMRGAETPKMRMTQLDDKIAAIQEETRRMKAAGNRLERSQRAASRGGDAQITNGTRVTASKAFWIAAGIAVAVTILICMSGLL